MERNSLARRGLMAAVIGMGVLIVVGTGALVAVIVHRLAHPSGAVPPLPDAEKTVALHEPAGTQIAQTEWRDADLVAVRLTGGGPDRVVIWNVRTGQIAARLQLVP